MATSKKDVKPEEGLTTSEILNDKKVSEEKSIKERLKNIENRIIDLQVSRDLDDVFSKSENKEKKKCGCDYDTEKILEVLGLTFCLGFVIGGWITSKIRNY